MGGVGALAVMFLPIAPARAAVNRREPLVRLAAPTFNHAISGPFGLDYLARQPSASIRSTAQHLNQRE
jgi:hypothetical protein